MSVSTKPWWSKDTIAVVTGANKGIGYEIARGLAKEGVTVVLTARDQSRGQAAIDALKTEGLESVRFHRLDVTSSESANALATWLKREFGGIDILVNNAGVDFGPTGKHVNYENAKVIVGTNFGGVKNVTEALLPLLRASPAGARIVNTSSRLGLYDLLAAKVVRVIIHMCQRLKSEELKKTFRDEDKYTPELVESLVTKYLEDVKSGRSGEEGWVPDKAAPMYSESKMFLNVYAITLANSLSKSQPEEHQILVTSFCPGPTETEMLDRIVKDGFNPEGFNPEEFPYKTVADGADTGVWLSLLPREELIQKNGKLFAERQEYLFGWENPPF